MVPDISEYQTSVNWDALAAAYHAGQLEGVIIRASVGTLRPDHQFAGNWAAARARNIPRIAYHFCYPTVNSPQAEAAYFNSVVGPLQMGEGQAGDFEDDRDLRWPADGMGWASTFLADCRAPQFATTWYTSLGFARAHNLLNLQSTWNGWQAEYGVAAPSAGMNPALWQFSSCASVPGVAGCCDASVVMRGHFSDLLVGGAPLKEMDMPPIIAVGGDKPGFTYLVNNPPYGPKRGIQSSAELQAYIGALNVLGLDGATKTLPQFTMDAMTLEMGYETSDPNAITAILAAIKGELDAIAAGGSTVDLAKVYTELGNLGKHLGVDVVSGTNT
jgi:GH25 family lysozyme M1 (1,4-beta-N-acetylmuramidase)